MILYNKGKVQAEYLKFAELIEIYFGEEKVNEQEQIFKNEGGRPAMRDVSLQGL